MDFGVKRQQRSTARARNVTMHGVTEATDEFWTPYLFSSTISPHTCSSTFIVSSLSNDLLVIVSGSEHYARIGTASTATLGRLLLPAPLDTSFAFCIAQNAILQLNTVLFVLVFHRVGKLTF